MNRNEFEKIKGYTYSEYCDYLQDKYGIPPVDYMDENFNKNRGVSRTKEGLIAHHKMEDRALMLSEPLVARAYLITYQYKENIVYCDYLEHLYLHVLICKYPFKKDRIGKPGGGGITVNMIPELNKLYSGYIPDGHWLLDVFDRVRDDKDVYFDILREFISYQKSAGQPIEELLYRIANDFPLHPPKDWDLSNNKEIHDRIKEMATFIYNVQE